MQRLCMVYCLSRLGPQGSTLGKAYGFKLTSLQRFSATLANVSRPNVNILHYLITVRIQCYDQVIAWSMAGVYKHCEGEPNTHVNWNSIVVVSFEDLCPYLAAVLFNTISGTQWCLIRADPVAQGSHFSTMLF